MSGTPIRKHLACVLSQLLSQLPSQLPSQFIQKLRIVNQRRLSLWFLMLPTVLRWIRLKFLSSANRLTGQTYCHLGLRRRVLRRSCRIVFQFLSPASLRYFCGEKEWHSHQLRQNPYSKGGSSTAYRREPKTGSNERNLPEAS